MAPATGTPCKKCGEGERLKGSAYCRTCKNEVWRDWWATSGKFNPKVVERKRAFSLANNFKYKMKEYGLTPEEFEEMRDAQGGMCAICGEEEVPRLHVDHDHQTGKVRGLLCKKCNLGLGYFLDDKSLLLSAVLYLDRNESGGQV